MHTILRLLAERIDTIIAPPNLIRSTSNSVYPIIIRPLIPRFSGCLHQRLILLLSLYNIIDRYGKRLAHFSFFPDIISNFSLKL